MRLALDVTYALDRFPSGVARYSTRITRELAANRSVQLTLCARWPRWLHLRRHFSELQFRSCLLQEPFNSLLPGRTDIFHGLNQRLPRYRFQHQVVTIHDVFPLSGRDYSTPEFQQRFSVMVRDAVARASRIICVSGYTRDRLCELLDVPPERCAVVHHGVDRSQPASLRQRKQARALAGDGLFFLCVGAVQVRKNVLAAAQAVAQIPATRGVRLLIAGGEGHGAEKVAAFVRDHNLGDRIRILGYTDPRLLEALYVEATGLLFPSIEEGFGLPVLEAMIRGLPVIASNTSAIPEVAGDAAILIDPRDVGGIAQAALRLVDDQVWREEWAIRGRNRARTFTWQRAAEQTMAVYQGLL